MEKSQLSKSSFLKFNPRSFSIAPFTSFLFFLLLNVLLSWSKMNFFLCLGIFLCGLGLILLKSHSKKSEESEKSLWLLETLPPIPFWVWTILFFMALAFRLFNLTGIPVWPTTDEGTSAFFALQLLRKWQWNLFFDFNHLPPLFFWLLGMFFKIAPPSLFSLWLFPALVSFLTVLLAYILSRYLFSKSFSLLWIWALALSFWPLYMGRFCIPTLFIPFWELFCLIILCLNFKNRSFQPAFGKMLLLGIAIGLGFYIFFNWPFVAFMLLALLGWLLQSLQPFQKRFNFFLLTIFSLGFVILPLFVSYWRLPHKLDYFVHLSTFQNDFSLLDHLKTNLSFLTALFWRVTPSIHYFAYKPLWGGILNPYIGSFFFLGLVEMFRERKQVWIRWCFVSVILFLLPIFFTSNLEMFRIVEVLPFLLFGVALGFQTLLIKFEGQKRIYFLVISMVISFGLDFFHLAVLYPTFWKNQPNLWDSYAKQRQCFNAYQILNQIQKKRGPGIILNEFTAFLEKDMKEQSLTIACFPFDAARNPNLGVKKAQWAAVFLETPDKPFLSQRFPRAQWYELGPSLYSTSPPHFYWMMVDSLTGPNFETFKQWSKANSFLEEILYESLNPVDIHFRENLNKQLFENHSLFKNDLYLESHFWKVVVDNLKSADQPKLRVLSAVQWGLKSGYPYPENYHFLGSLFFELQQFHKAREAYVTAGKLDPFFLPPQSALKELDRLEHTPAK